MSQESSGAELTGNAGGTYKRLAKKIERSLSGASKGVEKEAFLNPLVGGKASVSRGGDDNDERRGPSTRTDSSGSGTSSSAQMPAATQEASGSSGGSGEGGEAWGGPAGASKRPPPPPPPRKESPGAAPAAAAAPEQAQPQQKEGERLPGGTATTTTTTAEAAEAAEEASADLAPATEATELETVESVSVQYQNVEAGSAGGRYRETVVEQSSFHFEPSNVETISLDKEPGEEGGHGDAGEAEQGQGQGQRVGSGSLEGLEGATASKRTSVSSFTRNSLIEHDTDSALESESELSSSPPVSGLVRNPLSQPSPPGVEIEMTAVTGEGKSKRCGNPASSLGGVDVEIDVLPDALSQRSHSVHGTLTNPIYEPLDRKTWLDLVKPPLEIHEVGGGLLMFTFVLFVGIMSEGMWRNV